MTCPIHSIFEKWLQHPVMNKYLAKLKFKHNFLPLTNVNSQGVIQFLITNRQNFVVYDTMVTILFTLYSHCAKECCLKQNLKSITKRVYLLFLVFIVCCDVATHSRYKDFKRQVSHMKLEICVAYGTQLHIFFS